jgi:hypothetical protein
METIYWITRLDNISDALIALSMIAAMIIIFASVILMVNGRPQDDSDKRTIAKCKRALLITIPGIFIVLLALIFIPTTDEAYIIYGIGGTMDYLKSNKTAIGLPDKCIKAIDTWADNEINDSIRTKGK